MAVILCGGLTDPELFETRDKIVDALNSVKMAVLSNIHSFQYKFVSRILS